MRRFLTFFALGTLLIIGAVSPAAAAIRVWNGGDGKNNDWNDTDNWSGGNVGGSADDVIFGSGFGSGTTVDLNGDRVINSLTITTATAIVIGDTTADNVTLNSGNLTNTSSANQILQSISVTLGANGTWNLSGSGSLTVNGIVIGSGFGITKRGGGTLILNGANTYSGDTRIVAGAIQLGNASALQNSTLDLDAGDAGTLSFGTLTSATFGGLKGDRNLSLQNTTPAAVALSVGNNNASTAYAGDLSGSGRLIKVGTGTLTLSGNNTYSGVTTISGGVLRMDGASSLAGGNLTLNGGVLGLGAGDFTRALGTGNNQVQWTASGGFAAYGADRTVNLGGAGATLATSSSTLFGNSSADALILGADDATHTVTFENGINFNSGSSARTIQVNNGAAEVDAVISGVISGGTTAWNKTGDGTLILSGNNTFTTALGVQAGTLRIATINNASANGVLGNSATAVTLGASGTTGTLEYTGSTASTTKPFALAAGGTGAFQVNDSGTTLTLSGIVSGSGALTKLGAGALTLSGANSYSGATTISDGTVTLDYATQNNTKLSDTTALILSGASLIKSGGSHTEVVGSTTIAAGGSSITRPSGSGTLRMNTITRNVGGTLNLGAASIADADGTITVNSIVAWATINGTDWATKNTSGDGAITAYSGYTSGLPASGSTSTVNYSLTGSQTLTATETANSLKLNTSAASQSLNLNGNTLTLTSGGLLFVGANAYSITGGTLRGANSTDLIVHQYGSADLTIGSVIANNSGATALTKAGTGKLILTGANTYTGQTYINQGTLQIGNGGTTGQLGSTANVNNNGALVVNRSDAIALANNISGSGSLTKLGAGTLTVSGANTYTGGTTLGSGAANTGGDITLGAANALGSGGMTFAGGTLNGNNFSASMGALSLTADSTLNLVSTGAAAVYEFTSASWSAGTLTINNWVGSQGGEGDNDRIYINGSVDPDFLSHVLFDLGGGTVVFAEMSGNELVAGLTPVPEPTEWALIIFAALAVFYKFVLPRLRRPVLVPVPVSRQQGR